MRTGKFVAMVAEKREHWTQGRFVRFEPPEEMLAVRKIPEVLEIPVGDEAWEDLVVGKLVELDLEIHAPEPPRPQ